MRFFSDKNAFIVMRFMNDQFIAVSSRKTNVFEKAIVLALNARNCMCFTVLSFSFAWPKIHVLAYQVVLVVAAILFSSDFNHIFPSPI